jgi:hypothetical protein
VRPRGQIPVLKKQTKYLHIIISGGQGPLGVYEYWVTITVLLAQSHMPDMTLNCSTWEAESEGLSLRLAWATKIICFKKKKKEPLSSKALGRYLRGGQTAGLKPPSSTADPEQLGLSGLLF